MPLKQALDFFSAIGIIGWVGFVISLLGIGATIGDAYRTWPDKKNDPHWRVLTSVRISMLVGGASIAIISAALGNIRSNALQRRLDSTNRVAQAAQLGVSSARADIGKLRRTTATLAKESKGALAAAEAENFRAKKISMEVAKLSSDTRMRVAKTDSMAKAAASNALASQNIARGASKSAAASKTVALVAASSARESEKEAVAAAIKAHVYRLPDGVITSIEAALAGLQKSTRAFIACAPGLEEVCGQLAAAFRSAHINPTVRVSASFWTVGYYDADPLARTDNPNIYVAYMPSYAEAAQGIKAAFARAGLRADLSHLPANTGNPSIEILFHYAGAAP